MIKAGLTAHPLVNRYDSKLLFTIVGDYSAKIIHSMDVAVKRDRMLSGAPVNWVHLIQMRFQKATNSRDMTRG